MTDTKLYLLFLLTLPTGCLSVYFYFWVFPPEQPRTGISYIQTYECGNVVNNYEFDVKTKLRGRAIPAPFGISRPVYVDSILSLMDNKKTLCDTFFINQELTKPQKLANNTLPNKYPIIYISRRDRKKTYLQVKQYIHTEYLKNAGR